MGGILCYYAIKSVLKVHSKLFLPKVDLDEYYACKN